MLKNNKNEIYIKLFSLKLYICTIMSRPKEFDYEEKLTIARNLFWKKGYSATSMSDLEELMKINRSSLYQTYGTKHDLFLKSLYSYIRKINEQYTKAAARSDDPLTSIANVVYSTIESATLDANCLFTKSIFELALTDQEVGKILENHALKSVLFFEELIKKAQDNGTISSDREPRILAHFLVSGLVSINYNQILFKNKKLTKQTADVLIASISK